MSDFLERAPMASPDKPLPVLPKRMFDPNTNTIFEVTETESKLDSTTFIFAQDGRRRATETELAIAAMLAAETIPNLPVIKDEQ